MPNKKDIREQRLRRRKGKVRRIEVVLVDDSERDQYVSKWMDDHLGRGDVSEFTRIALEEKIGRLVGGDERTEQIERYLDELSMQQSGNLGIDPERLQAVLDNLADAINELRAELQTVRLDLSEAMREIAELRANQAVPLRPDNLPEQPAVVQSSGISMDRPRPRKQLPRSAPVVQAEADELSEQDQIRLAKIMANSIRRANPGRG